MLDLIFAPAFIILVLPYSCTTSSFNAFYSNHEVMSEKDIEIKESYLSLIKLVYETNKYLLDILAITLPDKI